MAVVDVRKLIDTWQLNLSKIILEQRVLDSCFNSVRDWDFENYVEHMLFNQAVRLLQAPDKQVLQYFLEEIKVGVHTCNSYSFRDPE